jgi:acetoin utilization deacetylase AcuC-like enzyme
VVPIHAVHDPGLVSFLERAWHDWAAEVPERREAIPDTFLNPALRAGMGPGHRPQGGVGRLGYYGFDTATVVVEGTYLAARAAVDVALTATDLVLAGENVAYALCRPPGHHAGRGVFGGYCYFNNAAIAAEHARRAGAGKVAVVDVDYHHGNGTQQIFYSRPDVLYASVHADPDRAYPFFTGWEDETGCGPGLGCNVNIVLPAGCDDAGLLAALDRVLPAVDAYAPDLVVVSLGLDTYEHDPLGDLAVSIDAYHPAGARLAALGRPLVVVQEGGYHLATLGRNVRAFLRGAAGLGPYGTTSYPSA